MFVESLALKEGLGNANSLAVSLTNLGLVERDAGRPEDAAGAFEEAIDDLGPHGRPAAGGGRPPQRGAARPRPAPPRRRRGVRSTGPTTIARELGDRTEIAYALADRARVDVERGALDEARRRHRRVAAAGRGAGRADHRPDRRSRRRAASRRLGARTRSRSGCGPRRPPSARRRGSPTCRPTSGTSTSRWRRSASGSTRRRSPPRGPRARRWRSTPPWASRWRVAGALTAGEASIGAGVIGCARSALS